MPIFARVAFAVALLASVARISAAQTTISTESAASVGIGSAEVRDGASFGQTFRVPNATDVFLQSFRIPFATRLPTWYRAFLMEWDPATGQPVGPVLYQSPEGVTGPGIILPVPYRDFDLGGVQLSSEARYLFFISMGPAQFYQSYVSSPVVSPVDVYPEGTRAVAFSLSGRWVVQPQFDAGFSATFAPAATVTPEPVSMALLGTGLVGVGAAARRRRRERTGGADDRAG